MQRKVRAQDQIEMAVKQRVRLSCPGVTAEVAGVREGPT